MESMPIPNTNTNTRFTSLRSCRVIRIRSFTLQSYRKSDSRRRKARSHEVIHELTLAAENEHGTHGAKSMLYRPRRSPLSNLPPSRGKVLIRSSPRRGDKG